MPLIQVTMIEGRDMALKRRLIADLTEATAVALEADPANVRVILSEVPAEHWGVEGEPLSDRLARRTTGGTA